MNKIHLNVSFIATKCFIYHISHNYYSDFIKGRKKTIGVYINIRFNNFTNLALNKQLCLCDCKKTNCLYF